MSRPRHPKKEIERAVDYAESLGWHFEKGKGHAWGKLLCPHEGRDGCRFYVWSTPRSSDNHARDLRRYVDACPHTQPDEPEDTEAEDE